MPDDEAAVLKSIPSLSLIPGLLGPGVVGTVKIQSIGQI